MSALEEIFEAKPLKKRNGLFFDCLISRAEFEFDPAKHPRNPAGRREGGRFTTHEAGYAHAIHRIVSDKARSAVRRTILAAQLVTRAYRQGGIKGVARHLIDSNKKTAIAKFHQVEERYGRKTAYAMVGAYLSVYASYAAVPWLAVVPGVPTAAAVGVGEALLQIRRTLRPKPQAEFMDEQDQALIATLVQELHDALREETGYPLPLDRCRSAAKLFCDDTAKFTGRRGRRSRRGPGPAFREPDHPRNPRGSPGAGRFRSRTLTQSKFDDILDALEYEHAGSHVHRNQRMVEIRREKFHSQMQKLCMDIANQRFPNARVNRWFALTSKLEEKFVSEREVGTILHYTNQEHGMMGDSASLDERKLWYGAFGEAAANFIIEKKEREVENKENEGVIEPEAPRIKTREEWNAKLDELAEAIASLNGRGASGVIEDTRQKIFDITEELGRAADQSVSAGGTLPVSRPAVNFAGAVHDGLPAGGRYPDVSLASRQAADAGQLSYGPVFERILAQAGIHRPARQAELNNARAQGEEAVRQFRSERERQDRLIAKADEKEEKEQERMREERQRERDEREKETHIKGTSSSACKIRMEKDAHEILKTLTGHDFSMDDIANVVGAIPGSEIDVSDKGGDEVTINVKNELYKAERTITKNRHGPYIKNDSFFSTPKGYEVKGLAFQVVPLQMRTAQALGFHKITLGTAGQGDGTLNKKPRGTSCGYYTWMLFGYNAPISDTRGEASDAKQLILESTEEKIAPSKGQWADEFDDMIDLASHSKEARDFWYAHGHTRDDYVFDLSPGSKSWRQLNSYIGERMEREKKKGESPSPSPPAGEQKKSEFESDENASKTEEIPLDEDDWAVFQKLWPIDLA